MTRHRDKAPTHGNSLIDSRKKPAICAVPMPELPPKERIRSFSEVALGYTADMAMAEAARCRQCKDSKERCQADCPLAIDVPGFIAAIAVGDFVSAHQTISGAQPLPGVCGRTCPQESLCRAHCRPGVESEAISIGHLERFIGDWKRTQRVSPISHVGRQAGPRVAVLGSGPAGLTCAAALARRHYDVTLLDTTGEPGGLLARDIPEFRLPREVLNSEIDCIRRLGVVFRIGANTSGGFDLKRLIGTDGYRAVFVSTDALTAQKMDIPGQNLNGVFNAQDFLQLARETLASPLMRPRSDRPVPQYAVIAGGGNAAVDCARAAVRMGAREVTLVYWRSLHELPARALEVEHARQEGIQFLLLSTPVRLLGSAENRLRRVECLETELGEPDASGRAQPSLRSGSEFQLAADTFVAAVGHRSAPIPVQAAEGLEFDSDGSLRFDADTFQTGIPGIFAGGKSGNGTTIVSAMSAGQGAARAIHQYLAQD